MLRQRTRSERRRVRFFPSVQIFALGFTNLRNFERSARSGSESFYKFSAIEVRTWHPNLKTISSITSSNASFFWSGFCSNWTSNFQIPYWDGYMLSNQTLIHETYCCSRISPTKMSYGFVGLV